MGLNNIEKKSVGYNILKVWVKFWHNKIYYRNYTILGTENIPANKPIIFTVIHQNALMDALALLFSIKKQLVFIARADIFKKPAIANILYFLKILPIYRVKDGFNTVKKNQDTILKTVDIMTSGNAIVILPEGSHAGLRRLRPLKKGFAHMAFQAEEVNNSSLDVHIVPVGLDYENYHNVRSSLIVNFGEPIAVKEYIELYKENSAIAINEIKQRLSEHIKPLIVNIESENNYNLYNELRDIYRSRMARILRIDTTDEKNRIYIDQQLIERVSNYEKQNPGRFEDHQQTVNRFIKLRDKFGFNNRIVDQRGLSILNLICSSITLIATLPMFIYGVINNLLSFWIPLRISKSIKDPHFKSSIKFVISFLSFPVFYIIQSLAVLVIFNDWGIVLVYFLSLPISASFAWCWYNTFKMIKTGWNYSRLSYGKNDNFFEMLKLYDEIIMLADNIMSKN
jgi:1-acyl-sn-glycerol-3-phosphate acyltransferase